jgi:hypothetical protein
LELRAAWKLSDEKSQVANFVPRPVVENRAAGGWISAFFRPSIEL